MQAADERPAARGGIVGVRPVALAVDVVLGALLYALDVWRTDWFLAVDVRVLTPAVLAVALRRVTPLGALALAWGSGVLQLLQNPLPAFAQIASAIAVYSAAAYGRRATAVLGAVSSVVGGAIAGFTLARDGFGTATVSRALGETDARVLSEFVVLVLPVVYLGAAWTAGFAVRTIRDRRAESARAEQAEHQAVDAEARADVETERAAMARDVHDVVGHSLAVIIAQADSVRFLEDASAMRAAVATIASTARSSLTEVREVLDRTSGESDDAADLDALLAQVRAAGIDVVEHVEGAPVELTGPAAVASRRVLQEMLTNALRHGAPGAAVEVHRRWADDDLVVEVVNTIGAASAPGSGAGVPGMRARLAAIGGLLSTERTGETFTASARIPLAGAA